MHITTLREKQIFHGYFTAGSQIHLSAGALCLRETASWCDALDYSIEIALCEGTTYPIQRSGWLQIRATKDAEFLSEVPEPGTLMRTWQRIKLRGEVLLTQLVGSRRLF